MTNSTRSRQMFCHLKTISAIAILGYCLWGTSVFADTDFRTEDAHLFSSGLPGVSENRYYQNSPHALPADYVFRTPRVINPSPRETFWQSFTDFFTSDNDSFFDSVLSTLDVFGWQEDSAPQKTAAKLSSGETLNNKVKILVSNLLNNAKEPITDDFTLTVSSFVNLANLYQTSSFGRYLSEQILGELQLAGLNVLDIRKTAGIMIREEFGEYGLSRDMQELSYIHEAQAMIAGTYSFVNDQIFVNARILRNSDGMLLSSSSLVLTMTPVAAELLADEGMPVRQGPPVQLRAFNNERSDPQEQKALLH